MNCREGQGLDYERTATFNFGAQSVESADAFPAWTNNFNDCAGVFCRVMYFSDS